MKHITFAHSFFLLVIALFCSSAHAAQETQYIIDNENIFELKEQYLNDLQSIKKMTTKAQEEIAEIKDLDKLGELILSGHRRQRTYYPPKYPTYPHPAYPVYLVTCFYQNNWGWLYNATAPSAPQADYIARYRCLQSSPYCAPAGCR